MTNFTFPFPALVCDTGGTNVRFALVSEPGGRLSDIVHLHTGDYPGLRPRPPNLGPGRAR